MLGKTVGSYTITKELGEGGMGAVYLAEHSLMGKQAAVKVLLPQYCAVQEVVDRFFNEAKSASMIKHPGIVDIYDFGTQDNGSAFIVMELLEGEPLSDLLEREPRLASARVALLGQQMARALQAAHDLGIVHRDLKPDNIFLEPDSAAVGGERPKILDFGIAKLGGDLSDSSVKTRTGAIMGTPIFMSPEQCTGAGHVDNRSDVYSLGCILYCMVCGKPPFVKEGAGALIAAHITEVPQALSALEAQVDSDLEAIIMSTLAKSPEQRPQSMDALANALGSITWRSAGPGSPGPGRATPRADTAELFGNEAEASASSRFAKTQASPTPGSSIQGGVSSMASAQPAGGPASSSTTLSGSNGMHEYEEIPRRRQLRSWFAGGLAVVAIGIAALIIARGDKSEHTARRRNIEPASETVARPAPPAATPPNATSIKLKLVSIPPAEVYALDNRLLGETPYTHSRTPAEGEVVFLLRAEGFHDLRVTMPADRDDAQSFTLKAVPPKPVAVPSPEPQKPRRSVRRSDRSSQPAAGSAEPKKPPPNVKTPETEPVGMGGRL